MNIIDLQSRGSDGDTFSFELLSNNHYWLNAFGNPFENDEKRETFQFIKTIVQLKIPVIFFKPYQHSGQKN